MNRGLIGALSIGVASALLAGCGGQIANSVPQGGAAQARVQRHSGSSGDLIYATGGCGGVCVLSYPKGDIVGSVHLSHGIIGGPCSDSVGNVFVTYESQVLEYQHGGTTPVATLLLPTDTLAVGCSVDPITNNLAVAYYSTSAQNVAIFANESGSPSLYSAKIDAEACGYDNAGNLFVSGFIGSNTELSELGSGQSTFNILSVNGELGPPGQVQWDGSYLTYQTRALPGYPGSIAQLTVSGTVATVVGTTLLRSKTDRTTLSWIYNGQVFVPYSIKGVRTKFIGIWRYPQGGNRSSKIKFAGAGSWEFQGITVSVAPSS